MTAPRYDIAALERFARDLFAAAGLETRLAQAVATHLVMADAMGHDTHGLGLAPWYLDHIADGTVTREGEPAVVSDRAAAVAWDGRRLPGAYLTEKAVTLAVDRAREAGTCTVAVGNSHHIGAHAAYLELATDAGMMVMIASSVPSAATVAPFGGRAPVYTPNPIAWGIPTGGVPILIDISASITTNNMAKRLVNEGRMYDHDWLMDAEGNPTNDPNAVFNGGTVLPTGGLDHGQKGYGLALVAESVTQGLSGMGRADARPGMNCSFTVQVMDPEAFGGREAFLRQTGWLADACRAAEPRPGVERVRLPGEAAVRRRSEARANGVGLYPGILEALEEKAAALGVALPKPVG
ncbi:Ldh family oxidoreductase [Psychromarinibacter sp. C21-152]|uniref:Ldh family oxidoreductase n=1 Tax=Psychromarinibacter sediminicola TaxID=3033385 RepID=A0AAE3T978_9RHOB|nr:Ldh family oxidoreductase [Psychromarinibacter sediminicola]MDF0600295.1 Ldh family oxidoreductase [Psychromarinibacter sediminicola]